MYKQANKDLWTGRVDSETDSSQFRHFQTIELKDINETNFDRKQGTGILGYAVDKGVELNNGRVGAQEGPDAIRKAFANLSVLTPCSVYDYGNVYHDHDALIETQEEYADLASKMFDNHNYSLLIGGGHDIAYAQYLAMRKSHPDASIGVIN
ncbi:formimidoylglutamase, partial [Staphylococcus nepalensis]